MPRQRRIISAIEAVCNTGVGFFISVLIGVFVYPLFNIEITIMEVSGITAVFTVISVLRGYAVRRLFVSMRKRGLLR